MMNSNIDIRPHRFLKPERSYCIIRHVNHRSIFTIHKIPLAPLYFSSEKFYFYPQFLLLF